MNKNIKILIYAIVLGMSSVSWAGTIQKIEINGLQRMSEDVIISKSNLRKGDDIDSAKINQAIKKLHVTGLFDDVSIEVNEQSGIIKINVKENPVVRNIIIKGNKKIETKTIKKEIRLAPLAVFSSSKLKQDLRKINDIYIKNGNLGSNVDYELKEVGKGAIDIVIQINEGHKAVIRNIKFIGNSSFSSNVLKSAIKTRENRWYHFAAGGINIYNEDLIAYDQELLRMFYVSQGYFDFSIVSVVSEIVDENFIVDVIFDIYEGDRYSFGSISINEDKQKDLYELEELVNISPGDLFNKKLVNAIVAKMNNRIAKEKHFSVAVESKMFRNPENKSVSVEFVLVEVPKIGINKINISGNTDTKDKIIRRQLKIEEASESNGYAINRSRYRVEKTGLFKSVELYQSPSGTDNAVDINIKVEEAQTTSINFGAGYDSSHGVVGVISVDEKNFRGLGQHINLSVTRNSYQKDIIFGFMEPYLNDNGWSAGFEVFSLNHRDEEYGAFKQNKCGVAFVLGREVTDNLKHNVRLLHTMNNVYDVEPSASQYIKEQQGKTDSTVFENTTVYSKYNNPLYPTDGFAAYMTKSIALPISKTKYLKTEMQLSHNKTVGSDLVLRSIFKTGMIRGYDDQEVKINNRFFLGMNDIRGFDVNGIGPRDLLTHEALGGNFFFIGKAQLERGIKFLPQFDFKWALFIDTATLFGIDKGLNDNIIDNRTVRVSSGAGLSWVSPLGPMRIDYGIPIVKTEFDKTKRVRFIIGWNF